MSNSSIPDGFSFAQLQELMKEAQPESNKQDNAIKQISEDRIKELVVEHTTTVREEIGDVSAYKHMAMYSLMQLLNFHNEVALECMEEAKTDNDRQAALCWARDAGWLQTCLNTLHDVGCGPNDWFTSSSDDDEDED